MSVAVMYGLSLIVGFRLAKPLSLIIVPIGSGIGIVLKESIIVHFLRPFYAEYVERELKKDPGD